MEVIQTFDRISGKKLSYEIVGRRKGDIAAAYADINKANSVLKWKAEHNLDEALKSAWEWEKRMIHIKNEE